MARKHALALPFLPSASDLEAFSLQAFQYSKQLFFMQRTLQEVHEISFFIFPLSPKCQKPRTHRFEAFVETYDPVAQGVSDSQKA